MIVSVKPLPKLKKKQLTTQQSQRPSNWLGFQGEQLAVTYLNTHGFHVLDQNVRYKNFEVDIIALDLELNELVFVEVKTRSSEYYGDPGFAVNRKKAKSLEKVALQYRKEKQIWLDFRFDVIAIVVGNDLELANIAHYPNITWEMVK